MFLASLSSRWHPNGFPREFQRSHRQLSNFATHLSGFINIPGTFGLMVCNSNFNILAVLPEFISEFYNLAVLPEFISELDQECYSVLATDSCRWCRYVTDDRRLPDRQRRCGPILDTGPALSTLVGATDGFRWSVGVIAYQQTLNEKSKEIL